METKSGRSSKLSDRSTTSSRISRPGSAVDLILERIGAAQADTRNSIEAIHADTRNSIEAIHANIGAVQENLSAVQDNIGAVGSTGKHRSRRRGASI